MTSVRKVSLSHFHTFSLHFHTFFPHQGIKAQRSVGLSTLSQTLLGRPLDKSMQVSVTSVQVCVTFFVLEC